MHSMKYGNSSMSLSQHCVCPPGLVGARTSTATPLSLPKSTGCCSYPCSACLLSNSSPASLCRRPRHAGTPARCLTQLALPSNPPCSSFSPALPSCIRQLWRIRPLS
ncbi:hypothetical protein BCR44DRAFT_1441464 [Catenaria anguillulae PL171]|uniref:Uncharacterized protein n=1 Tax=Catenaria anguillulae PL171 TaxID=765915 RepID=A0A1Y2HB80_9FUNG|nr:hypothetical protein BCR44DRAFT_1441464 [Catenaria anguillulae PL171]